MSKRNILLSAAVVLLLCSCTREESVWTPTTPATFDVKLDWVKATKVKYSITPDNPDAYYYCAIMDSATDYYNDPDKLASDILLLASALYDLFESPGDDSFAEYLLYKGPRVFHSFKSSSILTPATNHKLIVFQVDPDKRTVIGEVSVTGFTTRAIPPSDLTFDLKFEGDKLTITPSDLNAEYFWDYETKDKINDKYISYESYYRSLVDMYEEYDFMPAEVSRGVEEYEFTPNDPDLSPEDELVLVIAGYNDGEINTDITAVKFIYHSEGNIEEKI